MKKKAIITVVLSVIALSVGIVMNLNDSKCNDLHSIKSHNCEHHLTEARAADNQCPTCFRLYDEYGLCPLCDYEECSNCGNWTKMKYLNFCIVCLYGDPYEICENCGKKLRDCTCNKKEELMLYSRIFNKFGDKAVFL